MNASWPVINALRKSCLCVLIFIFSFCSGLAEEFTIVGLPDTQYYSGTLFGGTPEIFKVQTRWISEKRDSLNIVFVAHLGDIVEFGFRETQWRRAHEAMSLLEDPVMTGLSEGIPYGLAVGNHDLPSQLFNTYFGIDRFAGRDYYGGHYGGDNDNHFILFSGGGLDFIAVFLEYTIEAGSPILNWADNLLDVYSDRRAIVVHHSAAIGEGQPHDDKGEIIHDALKRHPNFFLLLCGHWGMEEWRGQVTWEGNTVYSLLSDYQDRNRGGDGWLRIMRFSPEENEIRVMTYSPTLDRFETDANSQFTLFYDMQTPTGIADATPAIPDGFTLGQNYPNPFNATTAISYQLSAVSDQITHHSPLVTLKIYNLLGQEVRTLVDLIHEAGTHNVTWNGQDTLGKEVPSGIYFYTLTVGDFTETKRMVMMK